jgi:hypothetical protein
MNTRKPVCALNGDKGAGATLELRDPSPRFGVLETAQ